MFNKNPSEGDLRKFMMEVSKLEAIEFMGLTKIFNVSLFEGEDNKPRNFETVLSEILDKYISLSRTQRRNIMKIIKSANLGKIQG